MRDIISEAAAILKECNATEKDDVSLTALEAADKRAEAESRQPSSDAERLVLRERYFRMEAASLGMVPAEIDNHWRATVEIRKILDGLTNDSDKLPSP